MIVHVVRTKILISNVEIFYTRKSIVVFNILTIKRYFVKRYFDTFVLIETNCLVKVLVCISF